MATHCLRPNLFIIGAMKSGTTTLHNLLGAHPQIFMCEPKEPCHFVPPTQLQDPCIQQMQLWKRENYLKLFEGADSSRYAGESSTLYTKRPLIDGVALQLFAFNPHARLIYIMRDPVERAISHYWHHVALQWEANTPLRAFRRSSHYTEVSDYHMQLSPYLEVFAPSQVYCLLFEHLVSRPADTIRSVYRWLGVDDSFDPPNAERADNVRGQVIHQIRGTGTLERIRHSSLWNLVGPLVPAHIRRLARNVAIREVDKSEARIDDAIAFLRERLQQPTALLSKRLGQDFTAWKSLFPDSMAIYCDG